MRIVHEDSKLGISKVVWRFEEQPDPSIPPLGTSPLPENASADQLAECGSEQLDQPKVSVPEQPDSDAVQTIAPGDLRGTEPTPHQRHLEDLRDQIRFLQQIIENQNQQLKTKDELIRNFQVLLKTEQEQVMLLEAQSSGKSKQPDNSSSHAGWFHSWLSRMKKQ